MRNIKLPSLARPSRSTIILATKALTIVLATLILFYQDLFIVITDALESEITSYILAIPILFSYLIYRKRKMVRAAVSSASSKQTEGIVYFHEMVGALLFLIAFLLYWYGSYTFTPIEIHLLALPIFVAACILIIFNSQTLLALAFPIIFLVLLSPPPSEIIDSLGTTLSVLSSEAAYNILKAFGFAVTLTEDVGTPVINIISGTGAQLSFAIDLACSGLYSLIGFLIFAIFVSYITREKLLKKAAIFLLGLPLILLLNIVRITTIVLLGYYHGIDLALQAFHLLGGWVLIFLGTILLLAVSERLLKFSLFTTAKDGDCHHPNISEYMQQTFCQRCGKILKNKTLVFNKGDLAKTIAVITSMMLILSIQVPVFAVTQGPIGLSLDALRAGESATTILPQMPGYNLTFKYRDIEFEQIAKQDASLVYAYTPSNGTQYTVWVTIEIAAARSSLHRWETCLITHALIVGRQARGIQLELKDTQLVENPPVIARYFAFQWRETNQTQTVLYWYETSTFTTNSTSQQKNVKISLIIYPKNVEELPGLDDQLKVFGVGIANSEYWQPIKPWSQAAILISHNGDKLVSATTALLIAIIILEAYRKRKEKIKNTNVYAKLSKRAQKIIDSVSTTEKHTAPTLESIATAHQTITSKTIRNERLLQELLEAEKTGLINSQIASKQDEPVQIWKTNLKQPLRIRQPLQKFANNLRVRRKSKTKLP